jgi:hypothetical protein
MPKVTKFVVLLRAVILNLGIVEAPVVGGIAVVFI